MEFVRVPRSRPGLVPDPGNGVKIEFAKLRRGFRVEESTRLNRTGSAFLRRRVVQKCVRLCRQDFLRQRGRQRQFAGYHIDRTRFDAPDNDLQTFDIHGGGQDLVFPHHENEIAQSEAATGKPFARNWVHHGMVNLGGEKMSKSEKRFSLAEDILAEIDPEVVRFYLLSTHYRSPIEFSPERLAEARVSEWSKPTRVAVTVITTKGVPSAVCARIRPR